MKKIIFKKGVKRINFPVLFPKDFREEIVKVIEMKEKLPPYVAIGFEARYWQGDKNIPAFSTFNVFIEKKYGNKK